MQNEQAKGVAAKKFVAHSSGSCRNCISTDIFSAYCRGVADGLYAYTCEEKRREELEAKEKEQKRLEAAKKAEEEERQRQIKRLEHPEVDQKLAAKVEENDVKLEARVKEEVDVGNVKAEASVEEEPALMDRRPKVEEVEDSM